MTSERSTSGVSGDPALLGIYLNDHLAGATVGVELSNRAARSHRGSHLGDVLTQYSTEIAEDREALLALMRELDVPVRQYKVYGARAAEMLGRLKPNGRLLSRSPLSTLIEVETLRLGVEGKFCLWRALRELAEHDDRLDTGRLDDLLGRARHEADTLEELRAEAATTVFG
ncbi:hypothetical protein BH20ACT6_BH20ACT6_11360 [soil metagenome]